MNLQVCGPRQPPTVQETLQIQRFHAECCKTQVLGPYHGGERGGGVSCFYLFGEPLRTWTYAMLMYSLPRHFTV